MPLHMTGEVSTRLQKSQAQRAENKAYNQYALENPGGLMRRSNEGFIGPSISTTQLAQNRYMREQTSLSKERTQSKYGKMSKYGLPQKYIEEYQGKHQYDVSPWTKVKAAKAKFQNDFANLGKNLSEYTSLHPQKIGLGINLAGQALAAIPVVGGMLSYAMKNYVTQKLYPNRPNPHPKSVYKAYAYSRNKSYKKLGFVAKMRKNKSRGQYPKQSTDYKAGYNAYKDMPPGPTIIERRPTTWRNHFGLYAPIQPRTTAVHNYYQGPAPYIRKSKVYQKAKGRIDKFTHIRRYE